MAGRAPLRMAIVGNPSGRRVALFQDALARAGQPPAAIVSYHGLIEGRECLEGSLPGGGLVRIESPGQDFEVERALLALGANVEDEAGPARISRDEAARLAFDRGRVWYPRQWFLGFREALRRIGRQLSNQAGLVALNDPDEVAVMFDKPRCHARLSEIGVPCPGAIGPIRSYDELRRKMSEDGASRVFVKLAHGSSASGVVALAVGPRGVVATTTAEVVRVGGEARLYNTRAIRRVEDQREVAALIDALAREGVHVERWIPKAGIGGCVFDLRVVVVAGRAGHVVVRMGRGPLTNLHLGNRRGDPAALRSRMGPGAWEAAMATCERAAAAFPGSLHAGVDLLIAPGDRRHAVLEVNAFGDLLHGVTDRGLGTHAAQVEALLRGWAA
ncbi:STM4014 family protein [Tundrisphaera sp. TA3]|uniref:STM4014 family protein n=1 Tax=Tundrisphaera sp. TA3 TaxID=3435775 RepID=UPI003EBF6432